MPPDVFSTPPSAADTDRFAQAVASFDPTASSVLIWTRAVDVDRVRWVVGRDEQLGDVVASGEADVDHDRDHTVVVDVDGLDPGSWYHFAFEAGGTRSRIGRTRTLPEGPTERVRLGVVACANLARAPLTAYRALAGIDDLDLVVHLGDYIYEDDGARGDIPVDPPHDLVSLEDYRRRYRQARSDADLHELHVRLPMVAIWDDHDIADNAWEGGAKAHDPDEHGPWPDRVAAATRSRQEWLPARLRDPDDEGRLWRSVGLGDLAEVVVLDVRMDGRHAQPDGADVDVDGPGRAIMSDEQWAWTTERIADRGRPWTIVASQVPVSEMHLPLPAGFDLEGALPDGYTVADGAGICTDQWDGYPAERRRLAELLDRRGGGAVVLSADVHSSWVFDGPFVDGRPVAGELTGSSVSSTTMGANLGKVAAALGEGVAAGLDHVRWVDLDEHGFMVIDVATDRVRGEMWAVDPADTSATARRMTAWEIGPGPGARWAEAVDAAGGTDGDDPVEVTGPQTLDRSARGSALARAGRLASTVAKGLVASAAVAALGLVVRSTARGARSSHRRR